MSCPAERLAGADLGPFALAGPVDYGVTPVALVGGNITRFRYAKGLTLRELSELTGLDFSYISKLERGLAQGSAKSIHKLATALGVEVDDLMDFDTVDSGRRVS